jgi:hypothetical protein
MKQSFIYYKKIFINTAKIFLYANIAQLKGKNDLIKHVMITHVSKDFLVYSCIRENILLKFI